MPEDVDVGWLVLDAEDDGVAVFEAVVVDEKERVGRLVIVKKGDDEDDRVARPVREDEAVAVDERERGADAVGVCDWRRD